MDYYENVTNPKVCMAKNLYRHISGYERDRIYYWRTHGFSLLEIAQRLGRNKSSISRELRRNACSTDGSYFPIAAQEHARERATTTHRRPRLKTKRIRLYVERKLKGGWSPEQIAAKLPEQIPRHRISAEAIYQYVYDDRVQQRVDLRPYLWRRHKRRHLKCERKSRKYSNIPNRTSIDQRPSHIGQRKEFGHWEADTIVSRKSLAAVSVTCERKSRLVRLRKMSRKTSRQMVRGVIRAIGALPPKARRSLTYDNGPENVEHEYINNQLGTVSYFCQPFHSWEKGTIENTIGLVRRYIPKGTDLATVSQRQLNTIERILNARPRKCLSFQTPFTVFHQGCT